MSVNSAEHNTTGEETGTPAETSLLRNKDFQALWVSRTLATIGKEIADVAYPLLILAATGSATYAGAVGSVQVLVIGLSSIPAGTLTDRMDRRLLMIICDVARLLLLGLFGVLVLTGQTHVVLVFATATLSAICLGISNPPGLAAIRTLVPKAQLTRATAQNQIRPMGATVVGSPIATALFGVGRALPFLATAVTFLSSALLLLLIKKPMQEATGDHIGEGSRRVKTLAGARFISRQPILRIWVLWIMGTNMAIGHTGAFLAVIATARDKGAAASLIGLTLSVAGSGALVGALLATWAVQRLPPSVIFLTAAWIAPLACAVMAFGPPTLALGIILALVWVYSPVTNALFFAYVAVLVPDELQGRVLGATMFMVYIGPAIGIVGVGSIHDLAGSTWVFACMGLITLLVALPTLTRHIRKLHRPEEMSANLPT
jgi:predicted MFS family arabinose efflux permease